MNNREMSRELISIQIMQGIKIRILLLGFVSLILVRGPFGIRFCGKMASQLSYILNKTHNFSFTADQKDMGIRRESVLWIEHYKS